MRFLGHSAVASMHGLVTACGPPVLVTAAAIGGLFVTDLTDLSTGFSFLLFITAGASFIVAFGCNSVMLASGVDTATSLKYNGVLALLFFAGTAFFGKKIKS